MKTTEGEGVGTRSLAHNTSGVEVCVGTPRYGLGRLTSNSITHTNLHKPNKLVIAYLEHFWCTNESQANTDSQNSPWPRLGGNHHLPPYSILCAWSRNRHPNVILSQDFRNFGGP
jgi:hypothetical protein